MLKTQDDQGGGCGCGCCGGSEVAMAAAVVGAVGMAVAALMALFVGVMATAMIGKVLSRRCARLLRLQGVGPVEDVVHLPSCVGQATATTAQKIDVAATTTATHNTGGIDNDTCLRMRTAMAPLFCTRPATCLRPVCPASHQDSSEAHEQWKIGV